MGFVNDGEGKRYLQESSRFLMRMLLVFLLLTLPASRKAKPHCITVEEKVREREGGEE